MAAAKKKRDDDDTPLAIADMLDDPWFVWLIEGIEEPALADPLADIVDALVAGQTSRASSLIGKASGEIDEIEDDPEAAETVFYWSILERYFEEAELI